MIARIILIAGLLGLGMAACDNTVRGVGQDTQKAGENIEQSTKPNPPMMP